MIFDSQNLKSSGVCQWIWFWLVQRVHNCFAAIWARIHSDLLILWAISTNLYSNLNQINLSVSTRVGQIELNRKCGRNRFGWVFRSYCCYIDKYEIPLIAVNKLYTQYKIQCGMEMIVIFNAETNHVVFIVSNLFDSKAVKFIQFPLFFFQSSVCLTIQFHDITPNRNNNSDCFSKEKKNFFRRKLTCWKLIFTDSI